MNMFCTRIDRVHQKVAALTKEHVLAQAEEENVHEEPKTPPDPLQRSTWQCGLLDRYSHSNYFVLLTDSGEPKCYAEASQCVNIDKWNLVMLD